MSYDFASEYKKALSKLFILTPIEAFFDLTIGAFHSWIKSNQNIQAMLTSKSCFLAKEEGQNRIKKGEERRRKSYHVWIPPPTTYSTRNTNAFERERREMFSLRVPEWNWRLNEMRWKGWQGGKMLERSWVASYEEWRERLLPCILEHLSKKIRSTVCLLGKAIISVLSSFLTFLSLVLMKNVSFPNTYNKILLVRFI